tara:strand:- start:1220 stop:1663 length:444 start_codon:yes stop_codon:yes gene_type:complete
MLDDDRAVWNELVAVLDAHPDGVLHDPASDWQWNARDIYCHLARWMNYSMDGFSAELSSDAPPAALKGSEDEINRRWQSEDQGVPFSEARRRAHDAFDRRVRLIRSVAPERWNARLEKLARFDGADHYRQHLSYIVVTSPESASPQS